MQVWRSQTREHSAGFTKLTTDRRIIVNKLPWLSSLTEPDSPRDYWSTLYVKYDVSKFSCLPEIIWIRDTTPFSTCWLRFAYQSQRTSLVPTPRAPVGSGDETSRVSDRYSDTTNNRTLIRGEISHADNRLHYGIEGWAYWIWQLKNGVRASIPASARTI